MEGRAGLSRRSASEGGGEEALRGRLPFQILKSQISNAPGPRPPTLDLGLWTRDIGPWTFPKAWHRANGSKALDRFEIG